MSGTNGIIAGIGDFGISQIKDEAVDSKDLAQQYAEDANEALQSLVGADFEGDYNITTNTPALTAIPSPSLNNGKYYIINGSGAIGFSGANFTSGQVFNAGDRLIKKGLQWVAMLLPQNTSKISDWTNISYSAGSQVFHLGKIYKAQVNALSTDIPNSNSTVWIPKIDLLELFSVGYSNKYRLYFLNKLNQVLFGLDENFYLEANGVTDRLGDFITNYVSKNIKYEVIQNNKYLFCLINRETNQIALAVTKDLKVVFTPDETTISILKAFGDSLTQGAGSNNNPYTNELQSLNPNINVINYGVGGETINTIAARIGGVPCFCSQDFVLPGNGSWVEISSYANQRLINEYGKSVFPLLQGGNESVNPVIVEGIECTMKFEWDGVPFSNPNGKYYIKRNKTYESNYTIKAKSIFTFNSARNIDSDYAVYFMGQNGGYDTIEQFIEILDRCIEYVGTKNFLVLGLHTGTPSERSELESKFLKRYSSRYVNLRQYFSSNAMIDMGMTPTEQDIVAMNNGTFPPSFWASPTDSIHGNENFYKCLGRKVNERFRQLGLIK